MLYPGDIELTITWREALEALVRREFGHQAEFLRSGERYCPPPPVIPHIREDFMLEARKKLMLSKDDPDPIVPPEVILMDNQHDVDDIRRELNKNYASQLIEINRNEPKIYSMMMGNISEASIQKLEEDPDYILAERNLNPYLMIKVIDRTHCKPNTGWDVKDKVKTLQALNKLVQKAEENDLDYMRRFTAHQKSLYDTVDGAEDFFDEQSMTVLFIEGLDNRRHAKFKAEKANLITQSSEEKREAEYPNSIQEAFRMLSQYDGESRVSQVVTSPAGKPAATATTLVATAAPKANVRKDKPKHSASRGADYKSTGNQRKSSDPQQSGGKKRNKYPCETCKILGMSDNYDHYPNNCPNRQRAIDLCRAASDNETSLLTTTGFSEHVRRSAKSGVTLMVQSNEDPNPVPNGKVSALVLRVGGAVAPHEIVKDDGSTCNIFKNFDIVADERTQTPVFSIDGVGGSITCAKIGTYAGVFDVHLSSNAPCNILSQAIIEDVVRSTPGADFSYNKVTCGYHLHLPGVGDWYFERRDDLGGLRVSSGLIRPDSTLVTISENLKVYPAQQRKKMLEALEFQRRADYISAGAIASAINLGSVVNSKVTSTDVYRAKKAIKSTVAERMGKATRYKPRVMSEEPSQVDIPKNVKLYADIFFVDNHAFLSTLSNFGYGMCAYLGLESGRRSATNIWKFLSLMFSAYVARGFSITHFECDPEKGFEANRDQIQNTGAVFTTKSSDSGVPSLDRRIRTAKERNRATRSGVPFKLFGMLLVYSVLNSWRCVNLFPCATSPTCSPRELFSGVKTDYQRDFPVAFGDYCLCYDTSNQFINSSRPRMEECIALMPVGNPDGDVSFLSLRTGRIITRNKFDILPTPDGVIQHINQQYEVNVGKPYRETAVFRSDTKIFEDNEDTIDEAIELPEPEEETIPVEGREVEVVDELHDTEAAVIQPIHPVDDVNELSSGPVTVPVLGPATVRHSIPVTVIESDDITADDAVPATDIPIQEEPVKERRYPLRDNRTTWKNRVYLTQVAKAVKQHGRAAIVSMLKEIKSIAVDKAGMIPVDPRSLSYDEVKRIIPSMLFLKEKFDPSGKFEKLKSRLVAGGHMQDRSEYDVSETSSPTVATQTVMMTAAIAAHERRHVITCDIGVAYLNANLPEGKKILMRLSREHAEMLCWLCPEYRELQRDDGTMIVRLTKALYGCVESARLWYNHLSGTLKSQGYEPNPIDICSFNKVVDGAQITVVVHVDDLMITSINQDAMKQLVKHLIDVYNDLKVTEGKCHKYLGMIFDFSEMGKCKITMPNFIEETVVKARVEGSVATPATEHLFQVREEASKLEGEAKEEFHSFVMSLQYLAKRVRPEILCPVVFLSTRVQRCDEDDWGKMLRVMKYLNGTKDMGIVLEPDGDNGLLSIHCYVDASFAVHSDFKSHTGLTITLGGGGIFFSSVKQKLNTTSSTEAELVGIADAMPQLVQCREYLLHQGYNVGPANLYQDNTSTIQLVKNGRSNSSRTRHINIRFFFIKDRVDKKEISLKHLPTNEMIADILTKPLQGEKFRKLRRALLNWP